MIKRIFVPHLVIVGIILGVASSAWAACPATSFSTPANLGSRSYINLGQIPGGAYQALQLDANCNLSVTIASGTLSGGGTAGAVTQGAGSSSNPWWFEGLGSVGSPAGGLVTVQGAPGGQALSTADSALDALINGGALSVAASALPLPSGAATATNQTTAQTPVAPAAATATKGILLGCLSNTTLPAFTAGQQGAIPCDASGRPYVNVGSVVAIQGYPGGQAVATADSALDALINAGTLAVSAAALPLPAGAAISANQTSEQTPVAPATATATKGVLIGCLSNTTLPAFTAGQQGAIPCDASGRPYVNVNNAVTAPVFSALVASTSSGTLWNRSINAASSAMATMVKGTAGTIYGYDVCNSGTGTVYFRVFNLATAPTVGTSTGIVDEKPIAAGACQSSSSDLGIGVSNGVAFDVTSASMADNDTATVATANTVNVSIFYK